MEEYSFQQIPDEKLITIINNFRQQDSELEHVEFKGNNFSSESIAKYISAITNILIIRGRSRGYLVWGIDNSTHDLIGTTFYPKTEKIGSDELTIWLAKHIQPSPDIVFRELSIEDKRVVVLIISPNQIAISKFNQIPYIRVGTSLCPLKDHSSLERELWCKVLARDYETTPILHSQTREEVLEHLDFETFYNMRQNRVSVEKDLLFDEAAKASIINDNHDGTYNITNLGALLYAKDLRSFPHLSGKSIRVIKYADTSKLTTIREYRSVGGYIVEFNRIYELIKEETIKQEAIGDDGIRRPEYFYPPIIIRELLANAITHQDLTSNALHPMVEIFSDRIEFTNSGTPLVPLDRFVDYPPRTRNRKIADEMVCTGICDSQGSGWDKVALITSDYGFPAPRLDATLDTTKVTMIQHRTLNDMTNEDRMWTIYIHACLLWTRKEFLTNTAIRKLFSIPDDNVSTASNLLSQALKVGLIAVFDEQAGNRNRKYIPAYAKEVA